MCGIAGYIGKRKASPILLTAIKRLEYRGYDSVGIATLNNKKILIKKDVGKIDKVDKKLHFEDMKGSIGIAHTRWGTTGAITKENSHPHTDCSKTIAIVHNGIIENYEQLRYSLIKKGHKFKSETDSEVIAHLLENTLPEKVLQLLHGRNAFLTLSNNKIIAAKNGSPLAIGIAKDGYYIASDALPFLDKTREVIFLEDGDIAEIKVNGIKFQGKQRNPQQIDWSVEKAQKDNYPHFLIKEIMEQPTTIEMSAIQNDKKISKIAEMINKSFGSFFIACGTASYAALAASYFFSSIAKKHINFCIGSEFPLQKHFLTDRSLIIAISQSGETADTLEAIKAAREKNSKIVAIVNVPGSTLMRQSDSWLLTNAGPEIAVCSTKAFTAQLSVSLLLAYAAAGKLEEGKNLLKNTALKIRHMLTHSYLEKIQSLAKKISNQDHIYIIGKGFNFPIALEAALKIKEVSYIHAEGFASGELKHGVIALIEKGTPCIAIIANDEVKQDILNGVSEIKLRGGYIIGISPENNKIFDYWLPVPDVGTASPIANVIPAQLLAYFLALERGCDPDYCRNLAKSVTVK